MSVSLPSSNGFYHPILRHLSSLDEPAHRQSIIDRVADILALDRDQRARLANDSTPSHAYRTGWGLSVLKKAGHVSNPTLNYWAITPKGRHLLAAFPNELNERSIADINAVWWTAKQEADLNAIAGTGQGTGLNAAERKAVELHAMRKAENYFNAQGWSWQDTHKNQSYDYVCQHDGQTFFIEVKGTTTNGRFVLITRKEVDTQRNKHPNNGLIVVHSIALNKQSHPPVASRGKVVIRIPWNIEQPNLYPTSYQYRFDE